MMANTATQLARFKKLIQKVNVKYLGRDMADVQKVAMLLGELYYEGQELRFFLKSTTISNYSVKAPKDLNA